MTDEVAPLAPTEAMLAAGDETLDVLLRGRVRLVQARKGYRSSVDAMALAFFASAHGPPPARCVDLGTGTGLVAILTGMRHPSAELVLIERQASLAGRARGNLALNGLQARGRVLHLDICDDDALAVPPADLIVSNPPYFCTASRIPPADPERRDAHYETTAGVERFAQVAAALVHTSGRVCMVYPHEASDRLVRALRAAGLGRIWLAALKHRRADDRPSRVLALARPGAEASTETLPDILLHPLQSDDSRYCPEIEDWIAALGTGD